jgi:hypothetical protein
MKHEVNLALLTASSLMMLSSIVGLHRQYRAAAALSVGHRECNKLMEKYVKIIETKGEARDRGEPFWWLK